MKNLKFHLSKKSVWVTAYDFLTAQILEEAQVDAILVGDSLGMVFEGKTNTHAVTIEQICYHTQAVKRGAPKTPVIGDLPIGSYLNKEKALGNAKKLIEAGADLVKLEGGKEIFEQLEYLVKNEIGVIGHIGLTPQSVEKFKVVGKNAEERKKLLEDAKILDKIGLSALVLECVPAKLAREITEKIKTPTIGIGAGKFCDGQILVFQDLVGLSDQDFRPKFLKRYLDARKLFFVAVQEFKKEVENKEFPNENHSY